MSSHITEPDVDEVGAEAGEGLTTPDPGPPKILPHAYFLLPIWLAGCVAL